MYIHQNVYILEHLCTFFGHSFAMTGEGTPANCPGMSAMWPFLLVHCLPEGPVLNSGTQLIDMIWKKKTSFEKLVFLKSS